MLPTDTFYIIVQYFNDLKLRSLNSEIKCIYEKSVNNLNLIYCLQNKVYDVKNRYKQIKSEYNKIKSYAKNNKVINKIMKTIRSNADVDLVEYVYNISNFACGHSDNGVYSERIIEYNSGKDEVWIDTFEQQNCTTMNIYINNITINSGNMLDSTAVQIHNLHVNPTNKRQILISVMVALLVINTYKKFNYVPFIDSMIDELINNNIHKNEIIKIIKCTDLDLSSFDL
jgi:hypothetical protein